MNMQSIEIVPANEIPFEDFCSLLEQLHKKKKQNREQDRILSNFFHDFKLKIANITDKKNSTLFPVLRLLLPQRDHERSAYNIKEKRLGVLLVKILSLPMKSQDAQKLINFRSVENSSYDSDFAGVAYMMFKNRVTRTASSLTLGDVNSTLDIIAQGQGKEATLDGAFSYAYRNMTAQQLKWFLRFILKDLKLAMGEHRILATFHYDAPDYFDNCADLNKMCEEFADGDSRPLELGIQLFCAVSPMLSERLNVTDISIKLTNKTYHIENKFDGERFQMHMKDGEFEYFSRKGYKYADNYGKTYDSGLLTPFLKGCFSESVQSVVLDGEMMGWHKEHEYFATKGIAFDVKKITDKSVFRPCFCVFDILFYNGKSLVGSSDKGGLPLNERMDILDTVFTNVPGVIIHSERKIVQDSIDILNALNTAIENQDEGIVVKDINSYYIVNKRNAGWYKIKPEYTDSTMTDLDLVIIGADEAENKRQGRAKCFHVACLDPSLVDGAQRWVCVGRVSSGLSHEQRARLCGELERHWTPRRRAAPPPCLYFNKELPDFWLLPERSVVLEVRATELIRSKDYGAAYTLRFPRVKRVRTDKPVKDIMTLQEFNNLTSGTAVEKLSKKRVNEAEIGGAEQLPQKRSTKVVEVAEKFRAAPPAPATSAALRARKLCVLSDDRDCGKADLVAIVESHGGKHVQSVGPDTWCAVAGKLTVQVKAYMKHQQVDIASTAWLRALPAASEPCALAPLDMLAIKPDTWREMSLHYDRFGDSYTQFTDDATLKKCFEKMQMTESTVQLTKKKMIKIDKLLFGDVNPFFFLRPCTIYVENPLLSILARKYAASLGDLNADLTHVVLSKDAALEHVEKIKKTSNALVVSDEWLEACFSKKKLVPEMTYLM